MIEPVRNQMEAAMSRRDAALALIQRSDFVTIATVQEDGFPESRLLFNLLKLRAEVLGSGPAKLDQPFGNWLGTNTSSHRACRTTSHHPG
jgi:hypothetical protein